MAKLRHIERHFTASDIVRDIVIGMSDGLTVPFALAAGLTGVVTLSKIVVTAGMAEIAAGAIAMGLGGYLAAKGDAEHYHLEYLREHKEVAEVPEQEKLEIKQVFKEFGLNDDEIAPIVSSLSKRPVDWVKFMMRFELGIEAPAPGRAIRSAATIASAYVVGGLIPLAPYMIVSNSQHALVVSIIVTIMALFIFGYGKGKVTGNRPFQSASQTALIGSLAAFAAYAIAKVIS